MKARSLRDLAKRVASAEAEPLRQALRYISRNTTLAPRARAQAQLQLGNMPSNTRITQVKNRCVETGRGRGVFRDFRLCRVCFAASNILERSADDRSINLGSRLSKANYLESRRHRGNIVYKKHAHQLHKQTVLQGYGLYFPRIILYDPHFTGCYLSLQRVKLPLWWLCYSSYVVARGTHRSGR